MFCAVNDIDVATYVDDNTLYMVANNVDDLITFCEHAFNALKINAGKCHLLVSTSNSVSINVTGYYEIDKSDTEKLIGVKLD